MVTNLISAKSFVSSLEGNLFSARGNLNSHKGKLVFIRGNAISAKGNLISARGNPNLPKGKSVSAKGNVISAKGNMFSPELFRRQSFGPRTDGGRVDSGFPSKSFDFRYVEKCNGSNSFFHICSFF